MKPGAVHEGPEAGIARNQVLPSFHLQEAVGILKGLQSAGNAGEYQTPRAVTQFAVDMIAPKLGETILDPACGTGGFLACAIEHVRKKHVRNPDQEAQLQANIRGVEKKPLPHLLEEDGIENNFPTSFRTRETASLFLVLIVEMLKDGGRAAVVLPDGTLFGEGVKTRIKEHLLQTCDLHTIVRATTRS